MRPIECNLHGRIFRGHGTTRVCRKLVFNFCFTCWHTRRRECQELMQRCATFTPPPAAEQKERAA